MNGLYTSNNDPGNMKWNNLKENWKVIQHRTILLKVVIKNLLTLWAMISVLFIIWVNKVWNLQFEMLYMIF